MDAYPESTGILVDFSEPMAAAAKQRSRISAAVGVHPCGSVRPGVEAGASPGGRYDAVVSRLASTTCPTSASASCMPRRTTCSSQAASS